MNITKPQYVPSRNPKTRAKSLNPESKMQRSCVKWFRYQYPQYKKLFYSIPNGGHRNKVTAGIMKEEGQLPGVLDLFLAVPRHGFHGLYIEMKYGSNGLSQEQKEFIDAVESQNYKTDVCYTLESFINAIESYLS